MPNPPKSHVVHLTADIRRRLVVPLAFAGQRVVVTSDEDDTFAPLTVAADGSLTLPCAADATATRLFVRPVPDRRAA